MRSKFAALLACSLLFAGCASVPTVDPSQAIEAKKFLPPSEGKSGLYIFRAGKFGGGLKKDIWVNGDCVGESAPDVFFYHEVPGNQVQTIATESEFSPNELKLSTDMGKNYFIKQYIKLGVFVGGANLKQVDEAEGKNIVNTLDMAQKGNCSK